MAVAEQTSEMTSSGAVPETDPSPPLVLKNRDTREGRGTNLHDLRAMCVDRDTKIGTLKRPELTKY